MSESEDDFRTRRFDSDMQADGEACICGTGRWWVDKETRLCRDCWRVWAMVARVLEEMFEGMAEARREGQKP